MAVHLSDHFTYKKIFKAVLPSVFMMVFTSIYSIVDGFFVSNYVGTTPFAAINLIMPVIMILGAIGFMMGTGGSAIIAKKLGEGDSDGANKVFSMVMAFTFFAGLIVSFIGFITIKPIAIFLGATDDMLPHCVLYGRILLSVNFLFMLQNTFQSLFITAEKPTLGFIVTVLAGVANIILDALFVAVFNWGLAGAAIATAISYAVGGFVPIIYFTSKNNDSLLRLVKTKFDFKAIGFACANGSSELVSNISSSIVSMLFNMQLLKLAGENGVAAYGVIMYASFIFAAIFIGYSLGTAPIVSYHYGAENHDELKSLLKKSLVIISCTGIIMTVFCIAFANPLSKIFVKNNDELLNMTANGMKLYGLSFLIFGINIFASSFFTSLNDGFISALISFMRTLVFQIATILIMPAVLKLNGVWLSVIVAEILSLAVSVACWIIKKKKYRY